MSKELKKIQIKMLEKMLIDNLKGHLFWMEVFETENLTWEKIKEIAEKYKGDEWLNEN